MGAKVKRKRFGNFQSSTSVVRYMRTRIDLSQTEVCKCSGWNFRPNDISKVERGIFNIQVGKLKKIAEFFDISIDTILKNDFRAILPVLPADRPERHEKAKSRREKIQKKMDEAGELGEKIVLEMEKERLKPLGLDMFVTADYADDESTGFDIYSFTEKAVPMHIEVKSSSGSDRQCFISANELNYAAFCAENNYPYKFVRIRNVFDEEKRQIKTFTAQELLQMKREAANYLIKEDW